MSVEVHTALAYLYSRSPVAAPQLGFCGLRDLLGLGTQSLREDSPARPRLRSRGFSPQPPNLAPGLSGSSSSRTCAMYFLPFTSVGFRSGLCGEDHGGFNWLRSRAGGNSAPRGPTSSQLGAIDDISRELCSITRRSGAPRNSSDGNEPVDSRSSSSSSSKDRRDLSPDFTE